MKPQQMIMVLLYMVLGLIVFFSMLQIDKIRPVIVFFSYWPLNGCIRAKSWPAKKQTLALVAVLSFAIVAAIAWSYIPHWPVALAVAIGNVVVFIDNLFVANRQTKSPEAVGQER